MADTTRRMKAKCREAMSLSRGVRMWSEVGQVGAKTGVGGCDCRR